MKEKIISRKDEQGRVRVSQMPPEDKDILLDIKRKLDELVAKYAKPFHTREKVENHC